MEPPNIVSQIIAIAALLLTNLVIIPFLILRFTAWQMGFGLAWPTVLLPSFFAVLLIMHGFWLLAVTVQLLHREGCGTLAPWHPTKKLVVRGIYAHVRNPMIQGIMAVLLGKVLVFGSMYLLAWLILFFIGNTVYFAWSEEPGLYKRFSEDYRLYLRNVPRWIPWGRPWIQPDRQHERKEHL